MTVFIVNIIILVILPISIGCLILLTAYLPNHQNDYIYNENGQKFWVFCFFLFGKSNDKSSKITKMFIFTMKTAKNFAFFAFFAFWARGLLAWWSSHPARTNQQSPGPKGKKAKKAKIFGRFQCKYKHFGDF